MEKQQDRRCRLQGSNLHQAVVFARPDSDENRSGGRAAGRSWPAILTAAAVAIAAPAIATPAVTEACAPIARPLTAGELEERAKLQVLIQDRRWLEERRVREILCRLRVLGVDYQ
jgi:hypothetical protein